MVLLYSLLIVMSSSVTGNTLLCALKIVSNQRCQNSRAISVVIRCTRKPTLINKYSKTHVNIFTCSLSVLQQTYAPGGTLGTIGATPKWQQPTHTLSHTHTLRASLAIREEAAWNTKQCHREVADALRRGLTAGLMMEMKSDERVYICLRVCPCLDWSGSVRLDMRLRSFFFRLSVSSRLPVATCFRCFSRNSLISTADKLSLRRGKKFCEWFCSSGALLTKHNIMVFIIHPTY